ncbi:peroxiredoxin [bacterium]|nr:peroxiredoxin [candidate division CSSED10-310 bacterium]
MTQQKAANFCLKDDSGKTVCLEDFRGKWVVLYFYPKDNTSGCTLEAKNFTESIDEFASMGAVIIGISPDSVTSHRNFKSKHSLSVILLSDPEHEVLKLYGVWQTKKMYGREFMGVVRTTVLINPDGNIIRIWPKVSVKNHVSEVLKTLREIRSI